MRTPPKRVRAMRLALSICLLAAVASLAAARPARADGFVYFDRMDVERCEEMGTCEWKLSCKTGDDKPKELIPNGIGGERKQLEIHQRQTVAGFPVAVACTAWEDDGILGTSWKEVATATLTLPGGGDYTLDIANQDQGTVHVVLRADSLEMGSPPPSGDPRRFLAVFRKLDEGAAVLLGMDWKSLDARRAALSQQGVQPVMLATYTEGKQRLWSAVFRRSPEEHVLLSGLEWEPFKARLEELQGKGVQILDFETYVEGKKRLFAGIFRPDRESSTLVVGQSPVKFQNQVTRLTGQGMRLADFEVYRSGNDLLYSGVFMPGSGSSGFRTAFDGPGFEARLKESGARLADVEVYQDGKRRLYDASFRGSSGEIAVENGVDWPTFQARWREHVAKGLRLIDVETLAGIGPEE